MKQNFIYDGDRQDTGQTKGVAIQISSDLYHKLEQENTPRNELFSKALHLYFNQEHQPDNNDEDIPIEIYEEIYSTLYNTEITPLKKQCTHQQQIISSLETKIQELQHDKQYFMNHCKELLNTFQKQKKSFWKKEK